MSYMGKGLMDSGNFRASISNTLLFLINFSFVFYVQILSNSSFNGDFWQTILYNTYLLLVLADIFLLLVLLSLPRIFQRVAFTLNILFSLFVHVYYDMLGSVPTFTSMVNGFRNISDISLVHYISTATIVVAVLASVVVQYLITVSSKSQMSSKLKKSSKLLYAYLFLFLVAQSGIVYDKGIQNFAGGKESFAPALRASIDTHGLLITYACEFISGAYTAAYVFSHERVSSNPHIEMIPLVPVRGDVVFMQVECLGYELLQAQVNGKYVMPFLNSLQQSSLVLKVDGIKLLGSANSDYELFTTRKASPDFMAYDVVKDFSGNIVESLAQKGFTTRMFHNVYGSYMNLYTAYGLMGFQQRYFAENMKEAAYSPLAAVWQGKVFSDTDLLHFAGTKRKNAQKKYFDFIITFTMHSPEYVVDTRPFSRSAYARFYKASYDTDTAIKKYYETLKEGTLLVIYGDHKSYFGEATPYTPFIVHVKGKNYTYADVETVFKRTDMSNYLRTLLETP